MDAQRFDRLSSTFANRFSRRKAVQASGLGLGAAALGAAGLHHAAAQDATPAGSPAAAQPNLGLPEGERTFFLFVQTAQSGAWAPKAGENGVYTLTLTGVPAQTVYFSDRPERIVGTQSTADFLAALGFGEENPPNAALVTNTDGAEDILVIELFNPVYTEDAGPNGDATLTYDARVLENYQETGLAYLADRQGDLTMPETFDAASLFIDDCADGIVRCVGSNRVVGTTHFGCCYEFPSCVRCYSLDNICENTFPDCTASNGCEYEITTPCSIF